MKICFILVLGRRYETCALVFYKGVSKKTVVQSAPMPHHSIEKMVSKKTCASPFYRGCFEEVTCTPRIYIYKMVGHKCRPEFTEGSFCYMPSFCDVVMNLETCVMSWIEFLICSGASTPSCAMKVMRLFPETLRCLTSKVVGVGNSSVSRWRGLPWIDIEVKVCTIAQWCTMVCSLLAIKLWKP